MNDPSLPSFASTLSAAYAIQRELGGGGMSRVFLATDRELSRSRPSRQTLGRA